MRWTTKSRIQNAVSVLPSPISYALYYWIQRRFGALRKTNPTSRLESAVDTWKIIKKHGRDPRDKVFFEVGTGRMPITPLAYWLMGAKEIITIDLNPYVKAELIEESLAYLLLHNRDIQSGFGSLLAKERMEKLTEFARRPSFSLTSFFDEFSITYLAPGDAAKTTLDDNSIDFHTSHDVFEHIPRSTLKEILREGNRIIRDGGLFIHRIDYSDHFSHSDTDISNVNFLQYSDDEWEKYAGNRYMYMNRLRHDDFLTLFENVGHQILSSDSHTDQRSRHLLKSGQLQLDKKYQSKKKDILSITSSWLISRHLPGLSER